MYVGISVTAVGFAAVTKSPAVGKAPLDGSPSACYEGFMMANP